MSQPITIIVVGSLNMDLTTCTRRLPHPGETLAAQSFTTAPGGKGANQAVACVRLSRAYRGAHANTALVKMIGAVGADEFGRQLVEGLGKDGIDIQGVSVRDDISTGVAAIIVEEETHENRILYTAGANGTLTPEHFPKGYFTKFSPVPSVVVLQLETPLQTVLHLLTLASESSVPTIFNPAPAAYIPVDFYPKITHLILNESETAFLIGEEVAVLDSAAGISAAANKLMEYGVRKSVVITLGARGAHFKTRAGDEGLVQPTSSADKVVDTTGAGDTFVGAFAVAFVEGKPVRECVEWASRASGVAVTRRGAQGGIPWRSELDG